jgi:preprotein translocase subunit YajC
MKIILRITAIMLLLLMVTGCALQAPPSKKQQTGQQTNQNEEDIQVNNELATRAQETAGAIKGVKESTAVAINRDVTVAVKVSGFDRLRLKNIKKEVHNNLKELDKDYNIHVTSDKKHYVQLKQIESQLGGPQDKSMSDLLEKSNKIIKEIDS